MRREYDLLAHGFGKTNPSQKTVPMKSTDEQLRRAMEGLCPPPVDADKREASLRHALSAFSRASVQNDKRAGWFPVLWLSAATVCVMAIVAQAWIKGLAPVQENL